MAKGSKVYKDATAQEKTAQADRTAAAAAIKEPTAAEKRFSEQASSWDAFIKGKDYGKPPDSTLLGFDLFTPAHRRDQMTKAMDLTGLGGVQLGVGSNGSPAGDLAKLHLADATAQGQSQAYENAIHNADAYYKGNDLAYGQMQENRLGTLLGDASSRSQYYGNVRMQTQPKSFMQTLAPLLGMAGQIGIGMATGGAGTMASTAGSAGAGGMGSTLGNISGASSGGGITSFTNGLLRSNPYNR